MLHRLHWTTKPAIAQLGERLHLVDDAYLDALPERLLRCGVITERDHIPCGPQLGAILANEGPNSRANTLRAPARIPAPPFLEGTARRCFSAVLSSHLIDRRQADTDREGPVSQERHGFGEHLREVGGDLKRDSGFAVAVEREAPAVRQSRLKR
jgi:hypothetical protein